VPSDSRGGGRWDGQKSLNLIPNLSRVTRTMHQDECDHEHDVIGAANSIDMFPMRRSGSVGILTRISNVQSEVKKMGVQ
jgi:hypothetical protein